MRSGKYVVVVKANVSFNVFIVFYCILLILTIFSICLQQMNIDIYDTKCCQHFNGKSVCGSNAVTFTYVSTHPRGLHCCYYDGGRAESDNLVPKYRLNSSNDHYLFRQSIARFFEQLVAGSGFKKVKLWTDGGLKVMLSLYYSLKIFRLTVPILLYYSTSKHDKALLL